MKKLTVIFSLIFCCLAFIISCGSKPVVNEYTKEIPVDTTYINDSIAKAKNALACDTPYKSVDILIIHDATTDDDNSMSFVSQMDGNGNVLSGGKLIDTPTNLFDPYIGPTNKVSRKALYYLAEYIDRQCDCKHPSLNDDSVKYVGGYIFRLIQNGRTKTCYVFPDNMDSVLQYLKGLQQWLKKSKYKREFKDLIQYIDYSEKLSNDDRFSQIPWWP